MDSISITGLDGSVHAVEGSVIEEFQQRLRGRLFHAGVDGYDDVRQIWNGTHDRHPALIVQCSGVADIIDAVNFVRDHKLLVTIRGGGHNVAGTAVADGAVMIDLSGLREVRVDPKARVAEVGPGATLGDLDRETQAFSLVAPAGIVSTTGVAGLTLAGGIGWLRRKYGLTIDNLISADVVTADGKFRRASESENPELFWAIRGGGGNFGIITSFCFKLHQLGPMVYFGGPIYPVEQASDILPKWRGFCDNAPEEVSSFFISQTVPPAAPFPEFAWNKEVVVLGAVYAGSVEQGERALQPLREMGEPLLDLSGQMPFVGLQQAFDGLFPTGNRYYWKTATLPNLNDTTARVVLDAVTNRSSPQSVFTIWQMGGAISRVANDATAFASRSAPYVVALDSSWTDPVEDDKHINFTRETWKKLQAVSDGGMYIHYGASEEDQVKTAYGDLYDRLAEIKAQYDPMNLFRVNQNIQPAVHQTHA
jgi:FAD/FMN-containing dehydrogenase